MDALEFIRERNRMCKFFGGGCNNCPADKNASCDSFAWKEELVAIVEKWSKENPRKTRQSVFLEQYPNAKVNEWNVLCVCPADIYGEAECANHRGTCTNCCREFWSQEVE